MATELQAPPLAREPSVEVRDTFACFGSSATVIVGGGEAEAAAALGQARQRLLGWHRQFSRFEPASELSLLNADPRGTVPVSPMMRRIVEASIRAGELTGGLVDATLGIQIERAGYRGHLAGPGVGLERLLATAPPRRPGRPHPVTAWRRLQADRRSGTVTRPPGVRIDLNGTAKGVFADELAALLARFDAFAVECAGDLRLGGRAGTPRPVHVASPFDGETLHTFELAAGGVATSGIGRRSWAAGERGSAHHLLDPSTGSPAFTGIVQATALAPTAAEAEARSKAALLSGPRGCARWLPHGGVVVLDDAGVRVLRPARR